MTYLTFNDVLEKAGITNLDRVPSAILILKTGTCLSKHILRARAFNSKGNMITGQSSSVQKALAQNCIAFIKSEIASNALPT